MIDEGLWLIIYTLKGTKMNLTFEIDMPLDFEGLRFALAHKENCHESQLFIENMVRLGDVNETNN